MSQAALVMLIVTSWYGLFLPARTPDEIKQKIHAAATEMLQQQAVRSRFETLGILPSGSTPAELSARSQSDVAFWEPIIKRAGIKPE
jgi:tripartite-type tricarboxylate transporter receptor subunit TctC